MGMFSAVARLIGIAVAIVAAFVAIPMATTILLVTGGISILSYKPEDYVRVIVAALLLMVGAKALGDIPAVGMPLAAIFGNLGLFLVGSSVVAIAIRAYMVLKADWVKA
ncbi:MAG TPA: hypothetical protein VN723_00835 [Rhizomicrobium sp.]|jgi:hypothetical protein|nr:hypothetical protein [Rhizomicrobium sp.]